MLLLLLLLLLLRLKWRRIASAATRVTHGVAPEQRAVGYPAVAVALCGGSPVSLTDEQHLRSLAINGEVIVGSRRRQVGGQRSRPAVTTVHP